MRSSICPRMSPLLSSLKDEQSFVITLRGTATASPLHRFAFSLVGRLQLVLLIFLPRSLVSFASTFQPSKNHVPCHGQEPPSLFAALVTTQTFRD